MLLSGGGVVAIRPLEGGPLDLVVDEWVSHAIFHPVFLHLEKSQNHAVARESVDLLLERPLED